MFERARQVLACEVPGEKCRLATQLWNEWLGGEHSLESAAAPLPIGRPGRPPRPELVHPGRLPKRSLHTDEGRRRLMHAVAHIEFNAINLACDAVYRFRGLPAAYYRDWLKVVADEARHFQMIRDYLRAHDCDYGDYPAHNGLWDMAERTAGDVLARMALVPRVLEARGLDVTPAMISGLRGAGDEDAARILETIYREEIEHVAAGSRWFHHVCAERGLEPRETFFDLVERHLAGQLRGPFNLDARREAGFEPEELDKLAGS